MRSVRAGCVDVRQPSPDLQQSAQRPHFEALALQSNAPPSSYRFGQAQLWPVERRIAMDGRDVGVGARAFDLLLALIERRDRLVTRDELLDCVWPDVDVEPNNIAVQIGALRKALGPHVIATVPGRGYRFSARVDEDVTAEAAAGPSTTVARQRTNLPTDPPPLIGRDAELRLVGALIDAHRIVTIVGAGGIGKTRLAQRLLHDRQGAFHHGICWVELASIVEAGNLPVAIAAALGIGLGGGDQTSLLAAAVAPLEILIGLDNAEHLAVETGRLVDALVAASARVRIVVTSQVPLHVAGEHAVRLGALAVSPAGANARDAARHGAIELFVQRARAADARFVFDDGQVAAVVRLCQRLDGLPLAIEFAAARAPTLGVERIVESLDERLKILKGGNPSSPARQRTMRATLEWSHQLLGTLERVVFRRLAVIAGSASLELIEAIVADVTEPPTDADDVLDRWAVVDALANLVDRSLVTVLADEVDADRPRYRLLETTRAYALERLGEAGETARLEERHARAVAALLADAWTDRWSGRVGFLDWIEAVDADRDNARLAYAWASQRNAFDLVLAMTPVLLTRSWVGTTYDERVAIADAVEGWLATRPPEPAQLAARWQLMRFWSERNLAKALTAATAARTLADAFGDRFGLYLIEAWLVRVHCQRGDPAAAAAALARTAELEDPAWPALRLSLGAEARSAYCFVFGESDATLEAVRHELRIVRLAGFDGHIAAGNLIALEVAAGDCERATADGFRLLGEMAGSRNQFAVLHVRINLFAALLGQDDTARAKPVAISAWQTARLFEHHGDCADCLALLCALEGRIPAAATLVGYADAVYAQRGAQRWPNELTIHERTVRIVRDAVGEGEGKRLAAEGSRLADAEVAQIAFEDDRVAPTASAVRARPPS